MNEMEYVFTLEELRDALMRWYEGAHDYEQATEEKLSTMASFMIIGARELPILHVVPADEIKEGWTPHPKIVRMAHEAKMRREKEQGEE